jgi:acetylornithine deacetylase/succinyl-diaminopimelate desuccinylase-like protein
MTSHDAGPVALAAALDAVSAERCAELCATLVDVASPTGDEAPLAAVIADLLTGAGAPGRVQPIDDRQANAWGVRGRVPSRHAGPTVMLYAPIDTVTTGDPTVDLPAVADAWEAHLAPRAGVADGRVTGLGAMNPKGHAACILAAVEALDRAGVELDGDLVAAFGAGGMPTNGLADHDGVVRRHHVGHGVGCSFLLEQGVWADAAVIAKSGWAIAHEEVGLAWCDVTVHGTHTYVGSRHLLPYRNAVAGAAEVVLALEEWLEQRAGAHTAGHVAPQGVVASIDGGWPRTQAFTPASVRIGVDLRLAPDQSPLDARRELQDHVRTLVADRPHLGVDPDTDVELTVAIPGSRTAPDHWITRCAVDAWEAETGRPHVPATATSGATDANILRNRGIPTVRVGLPKSTAPDGTPLGFAAGMNTVDVDALVTLTRFLVRVAIAATSSEVAR